MTSGIDAFDEATQFFLGRAVKRGISGKPAARACAMRLVEAEILSICRDEPVSVREITKRLGRTHTGYLRRHYLDPLCEAGKLREENERFQTV